MTHPEAWQRPPWLSPPADRHPPVHGADDPRVLQLTHRGAATKVAHAILHEFEDVMGAVLPTTRVTVDNGPAIERSRRIYKLAHGSLRSRQLADRLAPAVGQQAPEGEYDLFIVSVANPWNLFQVRALRDWRSRCRYAVCYIFEAWVPSLPTDYLFELLEPFDHVFVGLHHAVDAIAERSGKPSSYLPLASDVLRFAPTSPDHSRGIDVCNIGRRSPVTHEALLRLVREHGLFYFYDTVLSQGSGISFNVSSSADHRLLYANVLKRSRYYIANRAKIDDPSIAGIHEIPARYYEGIASGTVMLGEQPDCVPFREQFNWPNALVPMPHDCDDPLQVLRALESDPAAIDRARRNNVMHAAASHDWLRRVGRILEIAGIEPSAAMRRREERLQLVAQHFG